jgi:ribosomal protein S18 acetylase RimI-like enzyme
MSPQKREGERAMISVNRVPPSHQNAAISAIVAAFRGDPVAQWFYPDPQQYQEIMPRFVGVFAGAAFAHDSAYCTADYSAAALWLPPGVHPDEAALNAIVDATPAASRAAVTGLLEQMGRRHPDEPHWYLPMIGVVPEKQRHGYGSALLKAALARCDAEDRLAYLEASSIKSVPLYERHGFQVVGRIQVTSSPPLFSMVRKPRHYERKRESESFCPGNESTNPQGS